ncbi:cupin domain-containing protein [Nissabacter sp. SGAir0207]|uniref:cupin domain-containing protein n=1 Tax=Nissabacter sp. SGAir0207 TaxID=2126321 RepID=UPI0010CD5FDF|nr:cupin domain-containing protein [Nissabacter sp. SGAir0207]QCR38310.1 cytoplasmic protein [Nissabacter sp. SGAir0207]
MTPLKLNQPIPELQPIGSIRLLGATPTEGDPQAAGAMIFGEPGDDLTCGLFSATRGGFRMTYPFTEHATLLEGEIELTNEATGETTRYRPGDSWFVEQGTAVRWQVLSERFVKHYLANVTLR